MAEYTLETARKLLEKAIGLTSKPTLAPTDVDLLLEVASVDGVYTSASLNRAAATGWEWKANMVTDQYDLGGGSGKYLTRNQWWQMCRSTANDYRTGASSVDGEVNGIGTRGFGVIAVSGQLAGE